MSMHTVQKCITGKYFSYFSNKTNAVCTQKNRLNETVLLSTQNICLNMGKKIFTVLLRKFVYLNRMVYEDLFLIPRKVGKVIY